MAAEVLELPPPLTTPTETLQDRCSTDDAIDLYDFLVAALTDNNLERIFFSVLEEIRATPEADRQVIAAFANRCMRARQKAKHRYSDD
jgi:hypothetical protein